MVVILKSVALFALAGLAEIGGGVSDVDLVAARGIRGSGAAGRGDAGVLRRHSDLPDRSIRPGLRRLWRGIRGNVAPLGVGLRRPRSRPVRYPGRGPRGGGRWDHHVLAEGSGRLKPFRSREKNRNIPCPNLPIKNGLDKAYSFNNR